MSFENILNAPSYDASTQSKWKTWLVLLSGCIQKITLYGAVVNIHPSTLKRRQTSVTEDLSFSIKCKRFPTRPFALPDRFVSILIHSQPKTNGHNRIIQDDEGAITNIATDFPEKDFHVLLDNHVSEYATNQKHRIRPMNAEKDMWE